MNKTGSGDSQRSQDVGTAWPFFSSSLATVAGGEPTRVELGGERDGTGRGIWSGGDEDCGGSGWKVELGEVMGAVATREGGTVAYPRPRGGPSERDRVPP